MKSEVYEGEIVALGNGEVTKSDTTYSTVEIEHNGEEKLLREVMVSSELAKTFDIGSRGKFVFFKLAKLLVLVAAKDEATGTTRKLDYQYSIAKLRSLGSILIYATIAVMLWMSWLLSGEGLLASLFNGVVMGGIISVGFIILSFPVSIPALLMRFAFPDAKKFDAEIDNLLS